MTELAMVDVVGAWLGIFLTICILSFLYGDNPFYKLAEHLFVGVSVGYIVVLQLGSNFYVKLERGLTWWDAVPLVLVAMLFAKLASRRLGWLGKFPLAFVVALFAGQSIVGLVGSDLADQMKVAARPEAAGPDAARQSCLDRDRVRAGIRPVRGAAVFRSRLAHRPRGPRPA
jgi:hypothetical protein